MRSVIRIILLLDNYYFGQDWSAISGPYRNQSLTVFALISWDRLPSILFYLIFSSWVVNRCRGAVANWHQIGQVHANDLLRTWDYQFQVPCLRTRSQYPCCHLASERSGLAGRWYSIPTCTNSSLRRGSDPIGLRPTELWWLAHRSLFTERKIAAMCQSHMIIQSLVSQ